MSRYSMWQLRQCRIIRCIWSGLSGMTRGIFSTFNLRLPPLEVRWERQDSFPVEAGKWTLFSKWGGKTGALLEFLLDPRCSSPVETGMSVQGSSTVDTTPDTFMWRDLTGKTSQVSTCPLPEHLARNQNLLFTVWYTILFWHYRWLSQPPFCGKSQLRTPTVSCI